VALFFSSQAHILVVCLVLGLDSSRLLQIPLLLIISSPLRSLPQVPPYLLVGWSGLGETGPVLRQNPVPERLIRPCYRRSRFCRYPRLLCPQTPWGRCFGSWQF